MKKRNYRLKNWLHSLKRLWQTFIKSLKVLFTTDLSRGINWRSQVHKNKTIEPFNLSSEPLLPIPRPAPFLLGLDNIHNLESLTTKELIEQIEWSAESQEILTAKEEDLTLLEDLLVNFPDS